MADIRQFPGPKEGRDEGRGTGGGEVVRIEDARKKTDAKNRLERFKKMDFVDLHIAATDGDLAAEDIDKLDLSEEDGIILRGAVAARERAVSAEETLDEAQKEINRLREENAELRLKEK